MKWRRYRFYTESIDDWRPIIFNPSYPYWCSGYTGDLAEDLDKAIIVAWLPKDEDLKKYWPDADDIEFTEHESIEFGGRFPKPGYFVPLEDQKAAL